MAGDRERNGSKLGRVAVPTLLFVGAMAAAFLGVAGCGAAGGSRGAASAAGEERRAQPDGLGRGIQAVMDRSRYAHSRWGLLAVDLDSGRTIQRTVPDEMFAIASNTKLFTVAAGLEVLGSDHVFETPVVYEGSIGAGGNLEGDLILVAQGDITMGGRRNPDGTIAYTAVDHIDANAVGGAFLTEPDPLAGLDQLARRVAASGIESVSGEIIIDDRLFDTFPLRDYFISPIFINDNLVDLSLTPGLPGEGAPIDWRPRSAAIEVVSEVVTQDSPSRPIEVFAEKVGGVSRITVVGEIATDALEGLLPPLRVFQIGDLANVLEENQSAEVASFARTLFIEALERAGVEVAADALGANPAANLPPSEVVAGLPKAAVLVSAPFSEYAKLILKPSHNQGADMTAMLIGAARGQTSFLPAMAEMGKVLADLGLDPDTFAFADASGSRSLATPRTVVKLLQVMRERPEFPAFLEGLPILGVDGSLAQAQRDSPAAGHVFAKTGTGAIIDFAHLRPFLTEKAMGGYIDQADGRQVAFAVAVENGLVRASIFDDFAAEFLAIADDLGEISAILWSRRY